MRDIRRDSADDQEPSKVLSSPPADAKHVFDRLLTDTLAPDLKAAGFRKSGRKFYRRLGSIVQLIHFDGVWFSSADELTFHIDLAIWSDRVAALNPFQELRPNTRPQFPKSGIPVSNMCHWNARIGEIAPHAQETRWVCKSYSMNDQLQNNLRNAILECALPCLHTLTDDDAILTSLECNRYPNVILPPLYIAAFYRIARPLEDFDHYAQEILATTDGHDSITRLWSASIARMRSATPDA